MLKSVRRVSTRGMDMSGRVVGLGMGDSERSGNSSILVKSPKYWVWCAYGMG